MKEVDFDLYRHLPPIIPMDIGYEIRTRTARLIVLTLQTIQDNYERDTYTTYIN